MIHTESATPKQKTFFFAMTVTSKRTGERIARRCGVVFADDENAAYKAAWEQFGSDTACGLWVEEVPQSGIGFTVYKSEI